MVTRGEITATYEGGVLRPGKELELPEGARVTLLLRAEPPTAESKHRGIEAIRRIRREGLIKLPGTRWTREDLYDRR
jgi:predicted DNA-binding antitoxin AbrB/MazE fold protein